jgi:dihydroneopterin aldolase
MMNIGLEELKLHCIIGLFEIERTQKQDLIIDLDLEVIPGLSVHTDKLEEDTVDYFVISEWLRKEIENRQFYTLEALCYQCGKQIIADYPQIQKLSIKARKPQAIKECKASYVKLSLDNKK